jgi:hypothetical protein
MAKKSDLQVCQMNRASQRRAVYPRMTLFDLPLDAFIPGNSNATKM